MSYKHNFIKSPKHFSFEVIRGISLRVFFRNYTKLAILTRKAHIGDSKIILAKNHLH